MSFSIDIQSDIPKLGIFATDVMRRQMPFATMKTINELLGDVKENTETKVWNRSFDARNRRFAKLVYRREFATKQKLVGKLFDRLERANLEEHARGGTKTPRGRHVAVPSRELRNRRSGRGVPKNMRPSVALTRKKVFKTRVGDQPVIMRRKTKKRHPVEVLYILEPRARILRTFPFYREADLLVKRRFGPVFGKWFEKAMRTARPARGRR